MQGAEDELKAAVGLVRPVSVAFEVIQDFRFYKDGVFTSTTCGQGPTVCEMHHYLTISKEES